ncbi:MAG: hypothetical protein WCT04_00005, partial [Planctomycetota bacterium]
MPTPPPRKRFQFHLSTAIVLMFVAGGLIWANTRDRYDTVRYSYPFMNSNDTIRQKDGDYGWPIPALFFVKEWRIHESHLTTHPSFSHI